MSKRILNIYLSQDGDELQMRMICMYPWMRIEDTSQGRLQIIYLNPAANKADANAEAGLMHFVGACCDVNNINSKGPFWDSINFMPQRGGFEILENKAQYIDHLIGMCMTLPEMDYPVYQYEDMMMTLPQTDDKTLLMLLLALDPAIHSLRDGPMGHADYQITIFDQTPMPDFTQPGAIVFKAINPAANLIEADTLEKKTEVQQSLSRQVAAWLISRSTNQALTTMLKQLMESSQPSFTQAIKEKLYPQPTIDEFIRDNCKEGSAMSALFNPAIPSEQAEKKLKKELKLKTMTFNDRDREQASIEWYQEFAGWQWMLWKQMIEAVIGKPAVDGGSYNHGYTEIELLNMSEFTMNEQGDVMLNFSDTPSYKKYYDQGKSNYHILEQEMRMVCDLMGLHFLPDQDFHAGSVAFDTASTMYLKDRGFHITEDYVKSLTKSSAKTPRMFQLSNNVENQGDSDHAQTHFKHLSLS